MVGGGEGGWKGKGGAREGKGDGMERKAANGIARERNDDMFFDMGNMIFGMTTCFMAWAT